MSNDPNKKDGVVAAASDNKVDGVSPGGPIGTPVGLGFGKNRPRPGEYTGVPFDIILS